MQLYVSIWNYELILLLKRCNAAIIFSSISLYSNIVFEVKIKRKEIFLSMRLKSRISLFFLYASLVSRFSLFLSTAFLNNLLGMLIRIFEGWVLSSVSIQIILKGALLNDLPDSNNLSIAVLLDKRSDLEKVCMALCLWNCCTSLAAGGNKFTNLCKSYIL